MKHKHTENVHHIISQCLKDEYKIDIQENKLQMNIHRHNALHVLFSCLHTPKEQLLEMYYLYESVLNDTAKELFKELLKLEDKDFYIKEVLR